MLLVGGCLGAPATASAAAPVEPYQTNDFKGFHDVLPPGTNGLANGPGLAAFLSTGARPAHSDDQLAMYRDLVYGSPGVTADTLSKYYKDSSFGVKPGDVERTYSPGGRDDVTVVRDKSFGVPHVYATTRAGAMFALGYAAAEDRLFFIDILRHLGRAQLASFAGGAPGNRAFDQMQWSVAPYTEADFQKQIDFGLSPLRRGGRAGAPGLRRLRGRHQPLHLRRQARPDEDAGRVRGDQPADRAGAVEGERPHRHGRAGGRHLRAGRRR